jgi:hypothetical protein
MATGTWGHHARLHERPAHEFRTADSEWFSWSDDDRLEFQA